MSVLTWIGPDGRVFHETTPLGQGNQVLFDSETSPSRLYDVNAQKTYTKEQFIEQGGYGGEREYYDAVESGRLVQVQPSPRPVAPPNTPAATAYPPVGSSVLSGVAALVVGTSAAIAAAINNDGVDLENTAKPVIPTAPENPVYFPPPKLPDDSPRLPFTPSYDPYLLLAYRRRRRRR